MYFFFFQAEDGIRDLIVTGVQTCALPICNARAGQRRPHVLLAPRQVLDGDPPQLTLEDHRASIRVRGHGEHSPLHAQRSEEHTSELQSRSDIVCRLLLEKKKKYQTRNIKR